MEKQTFFDKIKKLNGVYRITIPKRIVETSGWMWGDVVKVYLYKYNGTIRRKKRISKEKEIYMVKLHQWVHQNKPKPVRCERCNLPRRYLEASNNSGKYKKDINDYEWLCRKCHQKKDGVNLHKIKSVNLDELKKLYVIEKKTINEIGKIMGLNRLIIINRLKQKNWLIKTEVKKK